MFVETQPYTQGSRYRLVTYAPAQGVEIHVIKGFRSPGVSG
jgi:hypothetical protein